VRGTAPALPLLLRRQHRYLVEEMEERGGEGKVTQRDDACEEGGELGGGAETAGREGVA
jgi:hypothetical protein